MLLEVVDDPSRRTDENVHAFLKGLALALVACAAVDQSQTEARVAAEDFRVVVDLHRQFPGRGQNHAAGLLWLAVFIGGMGEHVMHGRQKEGGGLAGAGLRLARQVDARQRNGQGLGLNVCAVGEARFFDALQQRFVQAQALE